MKLKYLNLTAADLAGLEYGSDMHTLSTSDGWVTAQTMRRLASRGLAEVYRKGGRVAFRLTYDGADVRSQHMARCECSPNQRATGGFRSSCPLHGSGR